MLRIEWKKMKTNNRVKELQKSVVYHYSPQIGQKHLTITVFSLNVSSASKGPFKAGKAKNMHQRCTFLGGTENIIIVDVVHNMKLWAQAISLFQLSQQPEPFDLDNSKLKSHFTLPSLMYV